MSCLSIRLPPAKKAWKSFTSKLQTKLHKLHKSKSIKKPKNRLHIESTSTAKLVIKPSLFLNQHPHQSNNKRLRLHLRCKAKYYTFKKKAAPVYIDKLFKEPVIHELVQHNFQVPTKKSHEKNVKEVAKPAKGSEQTECADDLWESLRLASPLMHGIDERAEEFITRFRAEMELQEMMTRHL